MALHDFFSIEQYQIAGYLNRARKNKCNLINDLDENKKEYRVLTLITSCRHDIMPANSRATLKLFSIKVGVIKKIINGFIDIE